MARPPIQTAPSSVRRDTGTPRRTAATSCQVTPATPWVTVHHPAPTTTTANAAFQPCPLTCPRRPTPALERKRPDHNLTPIRAVVIWRRDMPVPPRLAGSRGVRGGVATRPEDVGG